jgi:hypothetical protein
VRYVSDTKNCSLEGTILMRNQPLKTDVKYTLKLENAAQISSRFFPVRYRGPVVSVFCRFQKRKVCPSTFFVGRRCCHELPADGLQR